MRSNAIFARLALFISTLLIPALTFAYEPEEKEHKANADTAVHRGEMGNGGEESAKFNPGEMIMDHIADEHGWHLWGHTTVPLPVILKTDKGFEFFSSGNLVDEHHNPQVYQGTHYAYALEHGHIKIVTDLGGGQFEVNEEASKHVLDFSITKNVVTLFVVVLILCLVMFSVAKAYKRNPGQAPRGLQSFIEPLVIFVRDDVARPSIGHKYEKFMPYLLTVFFFILIANLLGLVPIMPGGANFTGNIAVPLVLATITFVITLINSNGHYWRHIFAMPGVPVGVLVILTPIEILGVFLRPFVLMIRLFANISAGHIIALAFYSLIFTFAKGGESPVAGYGVSIVTVLFTVFMMFMELLVAFLQAYVFTLLSAIYFGSAVEEHHGDHDHAEDFDGKPNQHGPATINA